MHFILQCILRNRHRLNILYCYIWKYSQTRRCFNFHNKTVNLLYWRSSFSWILNFILFHLAFLTQSIVRRWPFPHGYIVFHSGLPDPDSLSRPSTGMYCSLHFGLPNDTRFRILDICFRNNSKRFSDGSLFIHLNALFNIPKYDDTKSIELNRIKWSVYHAWIHLNFRFCLLGDYCKRNERTNNLIKEGAVFSS